MSGPDQRDGVTPAAARVYRRDRVTRTLFAALFCFGMLNAGLGPALPYLREAEHLSYLGGVAHQAAFAVGGGLAGLLTARVHRMPARALVIRAGLLAAALAWLAVGYGNALAITAGAALLVSLLGTAALIRMWAVLADVHGSWRTLAMTEGEVAVSFGAIIAPLLISGLAATALGWRWSFILAAALIALIVLATSGVPIPPSAAPVRIEPRPAGAASRIPPTLVIVFAIVAMEFSLTFWLASYLSDDVGLDRQVAVAMVSGLYVANLLGRLLASRLARRFGTAALLGAALALALAGMLVLLAADNAVVAVVGVALVGAGGGATFPLTSSLHVAASPRGADAAIGQVLAAASVGQVFGPVVVAVLAQIFDLRVGLFTLAGFALVAVAALRRSVGSSRGDRRATRPGRRTERRVSPPP
ncbi:MAG: MFS transporter [Pseudonocardiales bacterium]